MRRSRDAESYTIRFTPRKARSTWSAVNIGRVAELTALGRMAPAGLRAFATRTEDNSTIYAYENKASAVLDATAEAQFRANATAWAYFAAQPPGYRRTAIWWVISAKQEATRQKRLATLIEDSAQGRPISQLDRRSKAQGT